MNEKILEILRKNNYPDGEHDDDEICAIELEQLFDQEVEKRIAERMPTEETRILSDKELEEIFYSSLTTTEKYSSSANPFEMFKKGFIAAQTARGITLPNDEFIKSHSPYYGKSCNKYWFEGAKWFRSRMEGGEK